MNDAGLAIGWLWQSNVTFHSRCVWVPAGLQPLCRCLAAARRQVAPIRAVDPRQGGPAVLAASGRRPVQPPCECALNSLQLGPATLSSLLPGRAA